MDRKHLGSTVGIIGVLGNCILFVIKFVMGSIANSIAIIADSFNNLIDCTSSLITIIGFQMSCKGRDKKHPFGHGRIEYICGFMIALLILFAAFSLGKRSFMRLLSPEPLTVHTVMFLVPMCSILIKSCLIYYTTRINRTLGSSALRATVRESYADILITFLTITTLLTSPHTSLPIDGIAGLIIAVFIMWSGLTALSENMDLLIGKCIDETLEAGVRKCILSYDIFERIVSFSVHDYGPDEQIAIIQVELKPSSQSETEIADTIKEVSRRICTEYGLKPLIYHCQ
jgi:cation diffusion facilitator family transporter